MARIENITIIIIYKVIYCLLINIYVRPWLILKDKSISHIYIANIALVVADRANITITLLLQSYKSHVLAFEYLHSTFAHSKGQSQGHAHLCCEYLVIVDT